MSITTSDANYFVWEGKPLYICLIDKKGCLSGDVMKQIEFRSPQAIEALRTKMRSNTPSIGSYYFTGLESAPYLFIVARKTYHHKYDERTVQTILQAVVPQLVCKSYTQLRFYLKDYPIWFEKVIQNCDAPQANIILTAKCGWRE